jgi:hypothetical protein
LLVHAARDHPPLDHPMIKNLTTNQMILLAIATVLLLLAAFSFYLLQDPSAPLPFAPLPGTGTFTPLPTQPFNALVATKAPTRQTSYTPFAALLTLNPETPSEEPDQSETPVPSGTTSPPVLTLTPTLLPSSTSPYTVSPTSATTTPSPTATGTLSAGEYGVTGRVIYNSTPVANVVVRFADDVTPRQDSTNPGGHYWFVTNAPGTNFTLTFQQSDNPQVTPVAEVASLAWIEGSLPSGVTIIELPDLEISIHLNGVLFGLQAPADGASFSASAISASNLIPFNWTIYNQGESYFVQLGPNGQNDPIWTSNEVTSTTLKWNGTLDNGSHISQGSYWWRVVATKSLGNYTLNAGTQPSDILFSP